MILLQKYNERGPLYPIRSLAPYCRFAAIKKEFGLWAAGAAHVGNLLP
jgi:hypothetical protein